MRKDASSFQQDPDNTAAVQTRPDVTRRFDTVAGELLGIAERSGAWIKEQIHSGLQDAVSRFFGEPANSQVEKAQQHDRDDGRDR